MSREDSTDDRLASILVEFDEVLAQGRLPIDGAAIESLDDVQRDRLDGMRDCLRLLEQAWPRRALPEGTTGAAWGPLLRSAIQMGQLPRRLGKFVIRGELGRGGFGVVYHAIDPTLDREVALKLPRPDVLVDVALRDRFLREARAAAQLDHPNIVPVYECGELDAICFIASAYCRGPTLAAWLRPRLQMLPFPWVARLVERLADALRHAHDRGVVHRDLKPANVILEPTDQDELLGFVPRLTDFGLAKIPLAEGPETRTGQILGSPRYMSPEQAESRIDEIGPCSDLYSLGVIMYELLTGSLPCQGETDFETLRRHVSADPTPLRRLRNAVPRDLETICMKLLEKEPHRRYATAADLRDDLIRFQAEMPILARPNSLVERAARWARRQPLVAGLAATVIIGVVASFAIVATQNAKLNRALDRAATNWRIAQDREVSNARFLYAADIKLANNALLDGDARFMRQVLDRSIPEEGEPDLRGFEWWYLDSKLDKAVATFTDNGGEVYSVDFSPDGRRVASCGQDGTIRVRDVATGTEAFRLVGHQGEVNWVRHSPEGTELASASDDGTIRLWNASTGEEKAAFRGHDRAIAVVYSPDGRWLVSGGHEGRVLLWDRASRALVRELGRHPGRVSTLDYSSDNASVASGGNDALAIVWDVTDLRPPLVIPVGSQVEGVAFSADGRLLATAALNASVRVWSRFTGTERALMPRVVRPARAVAFPPVGDVLVSAGDGRSILRWRIDSPRLVEMLVGHTDRVWNLSISSDGRSVATASRDGTVKIWGDEREPDQAALVGHRAAASDVVFSRDGEELFTIDEAGEIRRWSRRTREPREVMRFLRGSASARLAISTDGSRFAAIADAKSVAVWDAGTPSAPQSIHAPLGRPVDLALAANRESLFVACGGETPGFAQIDLRSNKPVWIERGGLDETIRLALSPAGDVLACVDADVVRIWNVDSRQARFDLTIGKDSWTYAMEFSPDGRFLATGGADRLVRVWSVETGELAVTFVGHVDPVKSLAFSPDGRTLATGGNDNVVKLWSVGTGHELFTIDRVLGSIRAMAFSPDGRALAICRVGERKRDILLWDSRPDGAFSGQEATSRAQTPSEARAKSTDHSRDQAPRPPESFGPGE